jgi:hypothetical protein
VVATGEVAVAVVEIVPAALEIVFRSSINRPPHGAWCFVVAVLSSTLVPTGILFSWLRTQPCAALAAATSFGVDRRPQPPRHQSGGTSAARGKDGFALAREPTQPLRGVHNAALCAGGRPSRCFTCARIRRVQCGALVAAPQLLLPPLLVRRCSFVWLRSQPRSFLQGGVVISR